MIVTVEEKAGAVNDAGAWAPVPDLQVELKRGTSRATGGVWGGAVTLPTARGAGKYRLAIKEYETFQTDLPPRPVGPLVAMMPALAQAKRVVFANVIEI